MFDMLLKDVVQIEINTESLVYFYELVVTLWLFQSSSQNELVKQLQQILTEPCHEIVVLFVFLNSFFKCACAAIQWG